MTEYKPSDDDAGYLLLALVRLSRYPKLTNRPGKFEPEVRLRTVASQSS